MLYKLRGFTLNILKIWSFYKFYLAEIASCGPWLINHVVGGEYKMWLFVPGQSQYPGEEWSTGATEIAMFLQSSSRALRCGLAGQGTTSPVEVDKLGKHSPVRHRIGWYFQMSMFQNKPRYRTWKLARNSCHNYILKYEGSVCCILFLYIIYYMLYITCHKGQSNTEDVFEAPPH